MADAGPSGPPRDPFENMISLFAGPIAAVIRSFDQLRRGADELFKGLENFNRTMENLNATAERVNNLLNEFEEPARMVMPQVLRTVSLAEDLANRMSGPIDQVVPGLIRLADTLSSPVLAELPTDLGAFIDAINDLVRRLSPLGQLADSATGLFGLRLPGMPRLSEPALPPVSETPAKAPAKSSPPRRATGKGKAPAKRKAAAKHKAPAKRKAAAKRKPAAKRSAPAP